MKVIMDRCRGSLVGGAVGDALGYPVEFIFSFDEICKKYGENGISGYDLCHPWVDGQDGVAIVSDDTQMTLYTAEALVEAHKSGLPLLPLVCNAYLAWFGRQTGKAVKISYESKLVHVDELNQRRAPGNTCISALDNISKGLDPCNSSKGCGGIMRIAPIAVFGATHGWTPGQTGVTAGEAAEITHGHMFSTFSSAVQAMVIQRCILSEERVGAGEFKAIVGEVLSMLPALYPGHENLLERFDKIVRDAIAMEHSALRDSEVIENILGEGWVAEETLAISLFSVLRHVDDFKACMGCAVNHGGDSDSTGAVAGNLLGAILGYDAIPPEFTRSLQFHDLLLEMTDELAK